MTDRAVPTSVEIYDTTLRDGSQLEGISLTVEDKLRIAEQLDWLGVHYIEAGWPGANPKDDELFRRSIDFGLAPDGDRLQALQHDKSDSAHRLGFDGQLGNNLEQRFQRDHPTG